MGTKLLLFVILMLITILWGHFSIHRNQVLEGRKKQSSNILRENVLKKRLEEYSEKKVKFSKRYAIETLALQAGFKLTYVDFVLISFASMIAMTVIVSAIMHSIIIGFCFGLLGYLLPKEIMVFLKNRRLVRMEKQVGPFMQMVIKRYDTTNDFGKALALTLEEFKGEEPMYSEIKQTILELEVGVPTSEALDNMARRTGNKYIERLADYYKIASTLGTEEIRKNLLNQAYLQYEENQEIKRNMKKELAGPKNEAYIMLASIPGFAVYQSITNDDFIPFMTQTTTGQIGTVVISAIFLGCLWFINKKISAPLD